MDRILMIDNDPGVRSHYRKFLENAGCEVAEAQNVPEGVGLFRQQPADLVIVDIEKSGFEMIREFQRDFPGVRIIAISSDVGDARHGLGVAQFLGAHHVMKKPVEIAKLLEAVGNVLRKRR